MKTAVYTVLSLAISFYIASHAQVQAIDAPSFPSCNFPEGSTKVSYKEGIHGIPGKYAEYRGSDIVYTLNETQVLQCFCPDSADGIQTNWWKVSSLSIDQIDQMKRNGWIYIPNGSLWGLSEAPYLAYNKDFRCGEAGGKPVDPQVLGFASTGTTVDTILIGTGYILFCLGVFLIVRKTSKYFIGKMTH